MHDDRCSVPAMDKKAAYPRQPRTVRLAVIAAFVTALLAGPVTLTLFVASEAGRGGLPFYHTEALELALQIAMMLIYSAAFGLVGSIPAAAINTFLLAYLARRRRDAASLAIGSGLALGFLVGTAMAVIFSLVDDMVTASTLDRLLDFALDAGLPFLVAGGFMGALHWWIAIRPRRRWRLFQERERAALLAME
jgi:MFS family permease